MRSLKKSKKIYGFTLVELLIVVAIIGILATIGIPTFRQMVQKSKKSEAKIGLAGLYTAETAFFSEYGAYGSNLDKIGFDLEGSAQSRIYLIGFPDGACAVQAMMPLQTSSEGIALNNAFPTFYSGTPPTFIAAAKPYAVCLPGTRTDNGGDFKATATGAIAPGINISTLADLDQWQIDRFRVLSNTVDGVRK